MMILADLTSLALLFASLTFVAGNSDGDAGEPGFLIGDHLIDENAQHDDKLNIETSPNQPSTLQKRVVGFYNYNAAYNKDFSVADIQVDQYTHIKFAFIDIDADTSSCLVRDTPLLQEQLFASDNGTCDCCARGVFNQLFQLKKLHPNVSTMLAIGGWIWSKNFSSVARTPETRSTFVTSCINLMTDYGFDGIDIDWEFPGSSRANVGASGTVFNDNDTENMISLLQEFRSNMEALQSGYLLTLDVAPIPAWYLNRGQVKVLAGTLDWFNVMAYEFALDGRSTTRHSSNIFHNPDDPISDRSRLSFDGAVQWYLDSGVAPEQIVMGLPCYGRQYTGVTGGMAMGGLFGQITGARDTLVIYADALAKIASGEWTYHYDVVAQAAYASTETGLFVTFEDTRSVRAKCAHVNAKSLGGIMLWDMSLDSPDPEASLARTAYQSLEGLDDGKKYATATPYQRSPFCNIKEVEVEVRVAPQLPKKDDEKKSGADALDMSMVATYMSLFLVTVLYDA